MKKTLKFLLIAALAVVSLFVLTGCGKDESSKSSEGAVSLGGTKSISSVDSSTEKSGWEGFYSKYSELNNAAYDKLAEKTESFDIISFIAGDVDLAFTSSYFTDNKVGIEVAFGLFGFEDIKYSESGNNAKVVATSDGKEETYSLDFDGKEAEFNHYDGTEKTSTVSIYINGDTWAKSYSSSTSKVQIYCEGDNIYFGYDSEGTSEYIKASKVTKESATSMPKLMQLENGEFTSK